MIRKLFKFPGGVHPPQHKYETASAPIARASLPARLILPLHQHIGESAEPIVKVGERVLKGQKIAKASGYVSAPVHASTSGTVVAIEERPIPHPSGLSDRCIVIETDGKEEWAPKKPIADFRAIDASELRNAIRSAGIVGLGGAGFPTYIKLNPTGGLPIETLIINGAECEPYITCDDRLMRERAAEIIEGIHIIRHAVQAREVVVAIEDNKPNAHAAMCQAASGTDIQVVRIPTLYPQGGEKQLIKTLTGRECPSDGLPFHVGIVVQNVATAAAVYRAVKLGEPLISRIVTITGDGVHKRQNMEVLIGTPCNQLLDQCGGVSNDLDRIIMGGPMMGFALHQECVPVVKTTNCLLAATRDNVAPPSYVMPCIRCGACASACPVSLLPQQLYWFARAKEFDRAQDHHLFDCIECGCCAYVCPSNIPLVHYYRYAKTEIWAQEREKEKADLARQRHEHRLARIELAKVEKEAKLAKKRAALKAAEEAKKAKAAAGGEESTPSKQDEIQAAIARAKAKKAQTRSEPKNTEALTPAQQKQIDEAEARRKAAQAQTPPSAPEKE